MSLCAMQSDIQLGQVSMDYLRHAFGARHPYRAYAPNNSRKCQLIGLDYRIGRRGYAKVRLAADLGNVHSAI